MVTFFVYMLRCKDDSYYVGHTDDLEVRLAAHRSARFAGYTATRLPVDLVYCAPMPTRDEAFAAERRLKGWSRAKKEALIRDDAPALKRLARGPNRSQRTS